MKLTRGHFFENPVAFVCVLVSICFLLVLSVSVFRLPDVSTRNSPLYPLRPKRYSNDIIENERVGKFGEIMIDMLPKDLAFTIFMPSERAFERDLRLRVNESFVGEKMNDTYAILTRILGFSVVPRMIYSDTLGFDEEISFDSLSGFVLYISKDKNGTLIVNRVQSEGVHFKKGEIVVHIMNGVIMDAEFEQSVQPDYNEED